jgi:hypothetical protein
MLHVLAFLAAGGASEEPVGNGDAFKLASSCAGFSAARINFDAATASSKKDGGDKFWGLAGGLLELSRGFGPAELLAAESTIWGRTRYGSSTARSEVLLPMETCFLSSLRISAGPFSMASSSGGDALVADVRPNFGNAIAKRRTLALSVS